jgi:hypothetical protein
MSEAVPKKVMIIDIYGIAGMANEDQFLEH